LADAPAVLLIHPPIAKACEPPAGIARLAGTLHTAGIPCKTFDANLEGQLWLLGKTLPATDTWTRRALKGRDSHLVALRSFATYVNPDRYRRAVSDLNRLLAKAGEESSVTIGLADYQQTGLSPLSSADLLAMAAAPEHSPLFPWFSARLPELLDGVTIVGLSLNYLSQALTTFAMAGVIRRLAPQITIVLGGGLITSWLRRPGWSNPFGGLIDHLVAGPGEAFLLELCGATPPRRLPGPGSDPPL